MASTVILVPELTISTLNPAVALANVGVAVTGNRISATGNPGTLKSRFGEAELIELPNCLLSPGFVNAHQHGRGLSQIQLGYHDDFLELWIHNRRARGPLDPYPVTKLAAVNMVANGVTATIHANYSYGSGDYEGELRAALRAYDEVGIRVTMCVGAMDRGSVVYPPHEACFMRDLPLELRDWVTAPRPLAYAGDGSATVGLMSRLLSDFAGHPRIRLCYGPAGPQWVSDALLSHLVRDAERRDLGLHLHALESPAQAAAAAEIFPGGAFAHLEAMGALTPRTVLAHGVWVAKADIEILARNRAIIVRNAGCNLRLRNGIAPVAAYLQHGVRVAVGTDNAALADDEDLLKELRLVQQLAKVPDWNAPASSPTTEDLLAMAITNGVAAAQLDGSIGVIEVGAKADLIAISLDAVRSPYLDEDMRILEALFARAQGTDVRMTMVDGRILYRNGVHLTVDCNEIHAKAAEAAKLARVSSDRDARVRTPQFASAIKDHYRTHGHPHPPAQPR